MKHKIIISKNSGYCMGVKKAFLKSEEISKKFENIAMYGEMVHNRFALKTLIDRGIRIIDDLDEIINDSMIENVIIRAHGIPPEEEKRLNESGKRIFDLTCPKVKQVQLLAGKLTKLGYGIIIFGKTDHPEVKGIKGYCQKKNHFVLKNINDVDKIPFAPEERLALISQTTMNSDEFTEIGEILKRKFSKLEIFDTLCISPVKTQEDSVKLSGDVDLMIIVGDKMSANNNTLFEKVKNVISARFIETAEELDFNDLKNYEKIGISGGSSTPDWQIEKIKNHLNKGLNK